MTLNLPFVMEFVVYLTNRCNLRCEMCSQYGENFKELACPDLPFDEWKKFFDSISDVSPKPKIILMGGEPLLYKDVDMVIDYLNKCGFYIQIVTNGTLVEKHLETISKCKNITVTFSIDGIEQIHDRIRGLKGTFQKAIENIRRLNEIKKKNSNIYIYVNSVLLPDNIDDVDKFMQVIQKENVNQVVFQHLQFATKEMNELSKTEWESCLEQPYGECFATKKQYKIDKTYTDKLKNLFKKVAPVCEVETFVFPYLHDDEIDKYYFEKDLKTIRPYMRCTTPWLTAFIGANGDVSNCIENTIGNITKEDFWILWNNEKANKMRQALCEHGNFALCTKCCNFYKSCFLYAKDGRVNVKGKEYILPDELNYLEQSKDGVLVLNKSISTEAEMHAYPLEVYSDEMLEAIEKNETVLCHFEEIEY